MNDLQIRPSDLNRLSRVTGKEGVSLGVAFHALLDFALTAHEKGEIKIEAVFVTKEKEAE